MCQAELKPKHVAFDPWQMDFACESCGATGQFDERDDDYETFPWRRPSYQSDAPPPFRCPQCDCPRIRGTGYVERSVAEGNGANLRCWKCGLEERDPDGSDIVDRWRNPAYTPWLAETTARREQTERVARERADADKRSVADRWPWRPRVRTSDRRDRIPVPPYVEEIVRAPDDLYLRLVAADVIERTDPDRAAFIRHQIELDGRLRATQALPEHPDPPQIAAWSPELSALASERVITDRGFVRGFVEHVTMSAADFVAHADEVFERAPIRFLTITYANESIDELVRRPELARVRALMLPKSIDRVSVELERTEHGWKRQWFRVNAITDETVAALCTVDLSGLLALDVSGAQLSLESWVRIVRAAPNLRYVCGGPMWDPESDAGYGRPQDPLAPALEEAVGHRVPWLLFYMGNVTWWENIRLACA
jgi:uncharacterized protein (TIGR02996 family)